MTPEPQSGWTHKRDGYGVNVIPYPSAFEMKDPNDARWQPAVAYVLTDDDSIVKVRPLSDFLAKFDQAKELDEG